MKRHLYVLCSMVLLLNGCKGTQQKTKQESKNDTGATNAPCSQMTIDRETAILIAKGDAVENYTVSVYDITAEEQAEGWRIIFRLRDPGVTGGGPDYLIDKKSGKILHATYYK